MSTQKISIVLADDDEDDRLLFQEAIRELPVAITLLIVDDGRKLMDELNKLTKELPDLLFMDLTMPIKDGFECMSEIRCKDSLRHLPVVILSTHSNQEIIEQLYKAGATYYIRKPADFSDLKRLIRQAIALVLKLPDDFVERENRVKSTC